MSIIKFLKSLFKKKNSPENVLKDLSKLIKTWEKKAWRIEK